MCVCDMCVRVCVCVVKLVFSCIGALQGWNKAKNIVS